MVDQALGAEEPGLAPGMLAVVGQVASTVTNGASHPGMEPGDAAELESALRRQFRPRESSVHWWWLMP